MLKITSFSDEVVNWLTSLWILSLGAVVGLVMCLLLCGIGYLFSRIPVIGNLHKNSSLQWGTAGVIGLVLLLIALPLAWNSWSPAAAGLPAGGNAAVATAESQIAAGQVGRVWSLFAVALACGFGGMAVVSLCSRKNMDELKMAVSEGVLWPVFVTACIMSAFALLGLLIVRNPDSLLENLSRYVTLSLRGDQTLTFKVPAPKADEAEPPETELPVSFRSSEIQSIAVNGDQRMKLTTQSLSEPSPLTYMIDVIPQDPQSWQRISGGVVPFKNANVEKLYVRNYSTEPGQLTVTLKNQIAEPQMLTVFGVGLLFVAIFLVYITLRIMVPKLAAVAHSTAKSEIASNLYVILMIGGIFFLCVFCFIPAFTLGEDIKMLKDSGLSLILVIGVIQAVWAASQSVAEEIDGKTALTVLSKPVSRRDFILGKFVGIAWAVGLMVFILSIVLLVTVAYKPIYDAREGAGENPTWQVCFREMISVAPGLALAFLEVLVLAALSVAISTRLPMLPNFILCASIYVLGHLTPLLVQSQVIADNVPPIVFLSKILATILPVLDHFNIQASISSGSVVPTHYLVVTTIYCALYSGIAMLLALVLFEDRDLA